MRRIVAAKLHGIYVTEANLDYHGSISLDPDHCDEVGILPMEAVEIYNKSSGARISTYVIHGERGSRCCIMNGPAARTCQPGDQVVICNFVYVKEDEITSVRPRVVNFDRQNRVTDRMTYSVSQDDHGRYRFQVLRQAADWKAVA
jgi:aspartate 1-decarboxylase